MLLGEFVKANQKFAIFETLTAILKDQVYFEHNMVMDKVKEFISKNPKFRCYLKTSYKHMRCLLVSNGISPPPPLLMAWSLVEKLFYAASLIKLEKLCMQKKERNMTQ